MLLSTFRGTWCQMTMLFNKCVPLFKVENMNIRTCHFIIANNLKVCEKKKNNFTDLSLWDTTGTLTVVPLPLGLSVHIIHLSLYFKSTLMQFNTVNYHNNCFKNLKIIFIINTKMWNVWICCIIVYYHCAPILKISTNLESYAS